MEPTSLLSDATMFADLTQDHKNLRVDAFSANATKTTDGSGSTHDRETDLYLGSASVVAVEEIGRVGIVIPTGAQYTARMALAFGYSPQIGDEVLVISKQPAQMFVIGVLKGTGKTILSSPGDLSIEAPNGSISMTSGTKMRFESKSTTDFVASRITWRTATLEIVAGKVLQKADNVFHWVTNLWQTKCRRMRVVTDETHLVKAKRIRMKAKGNCNINGKTIHLG